MAYTLTLSDVRTQEVLWTDAYDDIELLAGMVAIGVGLIADANANTHLAEYQIESNVDLSPFRLLRDISEDMIQAVSYGQLNEREYGLWLRNSYPGTYNLYRFTRASFMQGVVSMATAFRIDFRNYMFGLPFDSAFRTYVLSNYIMTTYKVAVDVPDDDDIDRERADNEKVIELLSKDY